jgi:Flp pilus assembly CpaF family ATPase
MSGCRGRCWMDFRHSDTRAQVVAATAKILVAGGFGAGRTTLVGAIARSGCCAPRRRSATGAPG